MHNTSNVLIALTVSGQSNLTTGHIAATHGQFNGIRQVVPVVTPTYYVLAGAHPSPCPKLHLDWFSRFCTARGIVSLYFTMGRPFSPLKFLFPMGMFGSPSNMVQCAHPSPEPYGISNGTAVLHSSWQNVPILYNRAAFPPHNCPFPWGV